MEDSYLQDSALDTLEKRVKINHKAEWNWFVWPVPHLFTVASGLPLVFVDADNKEEEKGKKDKGESTKANHKWL